METIVRIKKEYLNPLEKQITYKIIEDLGSRVKISAIKIFDDWSIIPVHCIDKKMIEVVK